MREYVILIRDRDGTRRRVILWAHSIAEIAGAVSLGDVVMMGEAAEFA